MGLAEKYIPRYTYEDWLRWEGQWELVNGKYELQAFTSGYEFTLSYDCKISPELENIWE